MSAKSASGKKENGKKKSAKKKPFNAQAFLVEHGEKFAFGVCAVIIVWGIWSALGVETYKGEPEELTTTVATKREGITKNDPNVSVKEFPYVDFEQRVKDTNVPAGVKQIPEGGPGGDDPSLRKRTEPKILQPIEGAAHVLVTAFAVGDPNGAQAGGAGAGAGAGFAGGEAPIAGAGPPGGAAPMGVGAGGAGRRPGAGGVGVGPPGAGGGPPGAGGRKRRPGQGFEGIELEGQPGAAPAGAQGVQGQGVENRALNRKGVQPPHGSKSEGVTAVVLTYRVPAAEQRKLFDQAFADARRPRDRAYFQDLPEYLTFVLQQADVTDNPAEPEWKSTIYVGSQETLIVRYNLYLMNRWATTSEEVIDWRSSRPLRALTDNEPAYQVGADWVQWSGFDFPLGPILNEDFGDYVLGSFERTAPASADNGNAVPGIPGGAAQPMGVPGGGRPGGRQGLPGGAPGIPGGAPGIPGAGRPGGAVPGGVGAPPGIPGGVGRPGARPQVSGGSPMGSPFGGARSGAGGGGQYGAGPPGGSPTGPMGSPFGGAGSGPPGGRQPMGGEGVGPPGEGGVPGVGGVGNVEGNYDPDKDFLLRFFDFTVENGRRYTYRVKLVLENPNYQIEKRFLEDEKLAEAKYLESAWSDPTPPVTVSSKSQIVAGPSNVRQGGSVATRVIVRQRDAETGAMVAHEIGSVERGQVMNFATKTSVMFLDPVMLTAIEKKPPFEFSTQQLLVDASGGEKVGKVTEPTQMLLLDENGLLDVKSEDRSITATSNFARLKQELDEIKKEIEGNRPQKETEGEKSGANPMGPPGGPPGGKGGPMGQPGGPPGGKKGPMGGGQSPFG